jgi:hypothetical protein
MCFAVYLPNRNNKGNMKFKALVLACAFLASNASASIEIDFNGVGNGAAVNDYYNGGTDSLGNIGINYGIHFNGGVVNNGIVTGPVSVTFAPTNNVSQVDFLMSQTFGDSTIATFSTLYGEDRLHVDRTPAALGLVRGRLIYDAFAGLYQINFGVSQLDNLAFTSTTWNGPFVSQVPEPETYAMLLAGLGVVSFAARRKINNGKNNGIRFSNSSALA